MTGPRRGGRRRASRARKPRAAKPARPAKAVSKKKSFKRPKLKDGRLACERCLKSEGKRSGRVTKDGRMIYRCDQCEATRTREREFKHGKVPDREIMVMDRLQSPESRLIESFVMHQVRAYSLTGVTVYLKLEPATALRKQAVRVQHFMPPRKRGRGSSTWRPWYEASVGLRPAADWPVHEEIKVGTKQIEDEVARELMRKDWYFETVDAEWADAAEAMAYAAGVALHKVLRKIGQIEGRDVGTEARRFGLRWLDEFRAWRPDNEEKRGVQALLASG